MHIDHLISGFDRALRTFAGASASARPYPADALAASSPDVPVPVLTPEERSHAAGLMRVNHTGEICAQALYSGQAMTSTNEALRQKLDQAAREETDHLAWTENRLKELGAHRSLLNPLWYTGSFVMGAVAGLAGDRWNLGFLSETERQVERHLSGHLDTLPANDARSRAIVDQMRIDEGGHAQMAEDAGAARLPLPLRILMRMTAKVMTTTAYRI
jgi:ubiquinone biosynthesis monooxygenase Coq7